jgi:protein-tyrosine phosphatase
MTSRAPVNLRDVGGMTITSGGTVAHGVLLRSDAPYLGDDLTGTRGFPPDVVIDLRSPRERLCMPYVWPSGTTVHHHDLFDAGDLATLRTGTTMTELYGAMITSSRHGIAAIPALLSVSGATIVHCTAGKDRTGVTIAALLLLAGVAADDVLADFRHTETVMDSVVERACAAGIFDRNAVRDEWLRAPAEGMAILIEELTNWPDGPAGWFVAHGASEDTVATSCWRLAARPLADPSGSTS